MVKCEICGGHFNERFIASHKRLAHHRKAGSNEEEIPDQIESLFARLTSNAKQHLLSRLSAAVNTKK
jgi:hypothetical protein